MVKAIYFDMDGTIADLYGCENWLADLIDGYTRPYREAKPLVNMRQLGKLLTALQEDGYHIGIISWLSKSGNEQYNTKVVKAKKDWLAHHIGSVNWDEVKIVKHGTDKGSAVDFSDGILFDDEKLNRDNWPGTAYDVNDILNTLRQLLAAGA